MPCETPTAAGPTTQTTPPEVEDMEIPKARIVQTLRDRGDHDRAQQADQQLPDRVDPGRHRDLLGRLGIDPGTCSAASAESWAL